VLGRPEPSPSSSDNRQALKRERHLETTARLKERSPKALRSNSGVSVANLQNLTQTSCSMLPSIVDKRRNTKLKKLTYSVALVRKRTISTERPLLVGEVSANVCRQGCQVISVTDPYGCILGFLDRTCCVNLIDNTHYAPKHHITVHSYKVFH
jgi:hypothetical protein